MDDELEEELDGELKSCPNCNNHITVEQIRGMWLCGACAELLGGEERVLEAARRVRITITHLWQEKYIVRMKFEDGDYMAELLRMRHGWHYQVRCSDRRAPGLEHDPKRWAQGVNMVGVGDVSTPLGAVSGALDVIQESRARRERGESRSDLAPIPMPLLAQPSGPRD